MHVNHYKQYSHNLGREMEFLVYGHSGRPIVVFPAQDGRFYDFYNFGMVDAAADYINQGKIMLFCVDSIDGESWSRLGENYEARIEQHNRWFKYIVDEAIPKFKQIYGDRTGNYNCKFMTTGCSMGAYHALNFFLRCPDIFDGVIALSGLYHAGYFFPNYNNGMIYENSPNDYMRNMSWNHEFLGKYRNSDIILCCGLGRWEEECIKDTGDLKKEFDRLQVPI